MPIDDVVDKYFTTWDKEIQNSDGGMLYEMASYDGQRYGIPCNISDTDTFSYIWLRKDWMEALNLEAPKTMDDLKNIMVKFAEANLGNNENNYGMLIDKSLYYSTRGLFAGFKAYPEFWVEEDGKLVWGGTQENVKKALTFLNGLYNDGMLDKEFITQSNTDAQALILNSQTGIVYAGHWLAGTLMKLHDVDRELRLDVRDAAFRRRFSCGTVSDPQQARLDRHQQERPASRSGCQDSCAVHLRGSGRYLRRHLVVLQ